MEVNNEKFRKAAHHPLHIAKKLRALIEELEKMEFEMLDCIKEDEDVGNTKLAS